MSGRGEVGSDNINLSLIRVICTDTRININLRKKLVKAIPLDALDFLRLLALNFVVGRIKSNSEEIDRNLIKEAKKIKRFLFQFIDIKRLLSPSERLQLLSRGKAGPRFLFDFLPKILPLVISPPKLVSLQPEAAAAAAADNSSLTAQLSDSSAAAAAEEGGRLGLGGHRLAAQSPQSSLGRGDAGVTSKRARTSFEYP